MPARSMVANEKPREDGRMLEFMQDVFRRFGGNFELLTDQAGVEGSACFGTMIEAVDLVVGEIDPRLRALPGYARRLKQPLGIAFHFIDELVEAVPGPILCNCIAFSDDPRVSAFFVNPEHMKEVFSRREDVRRMFDENPEVDDCYALLSMKKVESKQFGMALVGDSVRGDVLQTTVSFTDHEVSSPNIDEVGTRRAIKCMIFKDLISYIQDRASAAKCDAIERDTRLKSLRSRLHHSVDKSDEEVNRADLETRIAMLENDIESNGLRAASLDGTLSFVSEVFSKPAEFLVASTESIR